MRIKLAGALAGAIFLSTSTLVAAKPVATVNGEDVSEDMLLTFQQQLGKGTGHTPSREEALDQLINFVLITQEAEKQGIDKRPDVIRDLAWQRRVILMNVTLSEYLQKHPVTDDEVKAMYDKFVKSQSGQEYKARHILVKTEDEAKAIIKQLDEGGDFAKLASEKSVGPTKSKGGDLGWFSPDRMVKPFADAVANMKKGSYTKTPVKTQFGWHVIQLEDQRPLQPPTLEEVTPQLKKQLTQEHIQAYFKELRDKAKVDMK